MYQRAPWHMGCYAACLPESISSLTDKGLTHGRALDNGWSGLGAQHLGERVAARWGLRAGREPGGSPLLLLRGSGWPPFS